TPNDDPSFVRARVVSALTRATNPIGYRASESAEKTFAGHTLLEQIANDAGAKGISDVRNFDGLAYHRVTDIEAERIYWLWPHRLAIGKICLHAGYPGTGKSQYAN